MPLTSVRTTSRSMSIEQMAVGVRLGVDDEDEVEDVVITAIGSRVRESDVTDEEVLFASKVLLEDMSSVELVASPGEAISLKSEVVDRSTTEMVDSSLNEDELSELVVVSGTSDIEVAVSPTLIEASEEMKLGEAAALLVICSSSEGLEISVDDTTSEVSEVGDGSSDDKLLVICVSEGSSNTEVEVEDSTSLLLSICRITARRAEIESRVALLLPVIELNNMQASFRDVKPSHSTSAVHLARQSSAGRVAGASLLTLRDGRTIPVYCLPHSTTQCDPSGTVTLLPSSSGQRWEIGGGSGIAELDDAAELVSVLVDGSEVMLASSVDEEVDAASASLTL